MDMPATLTILAILISAALTTGHAIWAARRRADHSGLDHRNEDPHPPPRWATAPAAWPDAGSSPRQTRLWPAIDR
jgi:hypothetical protein